MQVPEYTGTEIHKHHAKNHLVRDIVLNGCICYTWNFGNEHFLQTLKRICEGSNYKDEGRRMASFMSMKLARRSANQQRSNIYADHVVYFEREPSNLLSARASDDVLHALTPEDCIAAWELNAIVKENKTLAVGDWALLDTPDENGALIQITRMVQVKIHQSLFHEDEEPVALKFLVRAQAMKFTPGVRKQANRSNLLTASVEAFRNKSNYKLVIIQMEQAFLTRVTMSEGAQYMTFQERM